MGQGTWTKRSFLALAVGASPFFLSCASDGGAGSLGSAESSVPQSAVRKIGFGSCLHQDEPQPIWKAILDLDPDLFILTGDNVYADTAEPEILRSIYEKQASSPGMRALAGKLIGTWDDHDYGLNDGGSEFEGKEASKREFMRFFSLEGDSPMGSRDGIYFTRDYGSAANRIQVILLDTRWFRGPLTKRPGGVEDSISGRYVPSSDPEVPLLGQAQWEWLESKLDEPAALRVVVTSIQLLPEEHGWEKWGNLPHERRRFLSLLHEKKPNGVVLISGDRHMSEISKLTDGLPYPLVEVTSSSMNRSGGGRDDEPNRHRVPGSLYRENNFGWIEVDWAQPGRPLRLEIRDESGLVVSRVSTSLDELQG